MTEDSDLMERETEDLVLIEFLISIFVLGNTFF